ncbi:hypothetical protein Raf01_90850 [Rugosimonospora africana]|uniref:HD domain-containing protein n=1 Tax=Rugosimonospora africana TaxID=556532 RepID=A0A8J3R1T3_9ACTN|nr:hypothetical protein Raf01_90850 [Rugosimonospora africana]
MVATAFGLARQWCAGREIDGHPTLSHAVRVAVKLDQHLPAVPPQLIAAVLVHNSPEFAPATVDVDAALTVWLGPEITRVVAAMHREHAAMDAGVPAVPPLRDLWTLYASAADKIVSVGSILARAAAADDPKDFWCGRQAFVALVPYFREFHTATSARLPAGLRDELGLAVALAESATAAPASTAAAGDAGGSSCPGRWGRAS